MQQISLILIWMERMDDSCNANPLKVKNVNFFLNFINAVSIFVELVGRKCFAFYSLSFWF